MTPLAQKKVNQNNSHAEKELMAALFSKLYEAINDVEQGEVQTIEEAWEEIHAV